MESVGILLSQSALAGPAEIIKYVIACNAVLLVNPFIHPATILYQKLNAFCLIVGFSISLILILISQNVSDFLRCIY